MPSTTLRELNGFDQTPASPATATLILIDYQNTYTQGVMELDGWDAALDAAVIAHGDHLRPGRRRAGGGEAGPQRLPGHRPGR
jgi:hypothetical protein